MVNNGDNEGVVGNNTRAEKTKSTQDRCTGGNEAEEGYGNTRITNCPITNARITKHLKLKPQTS